MGPVHLSRDRARKKLVFANSFSDEKARRDASLGQPQVAEEYVLDFTFEDAPGGKTKFTVCWLALDATEEQQKTFDTHDSMTQGWGGTLDQLAAYLANAKA